MDKGTKGQRDKGTKGQRDKGTKGQRDKGTKGQKDKGTKVQHFNVTRNNPEKFYLYVSNVIVCFLREYISYCTVHI